MPFANRLVFPAQVFQNMNQRLVRVAAQAIQDGQRKLARGAKSAEVHSAALPAVAAVDQARKMARRSGHVG